jgi:hypothetical protein
MIDRRIATLHAPLGRLGTSSLLRILGDKAWETVIINSTEPDLLYTRRMDGDLHEEVLCS